MGISRDDLISNLNMAAEIGVISSVEDIGIMDVRIKTNSGIEYKIVWFVNYCTLIGVDLSAYFDSIKISNSSPSMRHHIDFISEGVSSLSIGDFIDGQGIKS